MVENSNFLNRLRNGYLEKSVATGICRVQRSPKTAKTPLKVHLRLRFQNLGKPRTAGLCGRASGACDCGPLSGAKIERPPPPRKPSCKVRLFAQKRSRKYRQKVTAATPSPTVSHPAFQLVAQTPHVCFHRQTWVQLGFQRKIAHKGTHGETGGVPSIGHSTVLSCQRNSFYSTVLLYTYISRFTVTPHLSAEEKYPAKLPSQLCSKPLFIAFFNFSHKRLTFAFVHESEYTLGPAQRIAHNGTHGKTGAFRMGPLSLPST